MNLYLFTSFLTCISTGYFALVQRHLKLIKGFDEICYLFINDRFRVKKPFLV
jgi:hypothetical protein